MTHDVAEDIDLYSDLSTVNYEDCIKQLKSSNCQLLQQLESLKIELSGSLKEKEKLESQCQVLSNNISSLFKTAKAEIERKNRTISELRSEINNVVFRRNKIGGRFGRAQNDKPETLSKSNLWKERIEDISERRSDSSRAHDEPESFSFKSNLRKERNEIISDPRLSRPDRRPDSSRVLDESDTSSRSNLKKEESEAVTKRRPSRDHTEHESSSSKSNLRKKRSEYVSDPQLHRTERRLDLCRAHNESEASSSKSNLKRERIENVPDPRLEKVNRSVESTSTESGQKVRDLSRVEGNNYSLAATSSEEDCNLKNSASKNPEIEGSVEIISNRNRRLEQTRSKSGRQFLRREDLRNTLKRRHHVESQREAYRTRSRSGQNKAQQTSTKTGFSPIKEQQDIYCSALEKPLDNNFSVLEKPLDSNSIIPDNQSVKADEIPTISLETLNSSDHLLSNGSNDHEEITSKGILPQKKLTGLMGSTETVVMTEYTKRMLRRIQETFNPKIDKNTITTPDNTGKASNCKTKFSSLPSIKITDVSTSKIFDPLSNSSVANPEELPLSPNGKEKLLVSESTGIVESKKLVAPDKFAAITDNLSIPGFNVSLDLSISSSSNSEIGELNSSKISHENCSIIVSNVKELSDNPIDNQVNVSNNQCEQEITNITKTELLTKGIFSNKLSVLDKIDIQSSCNTNFAVTSNKDTTEDISVNKNNQNHIVNAETIKSNAVINNPCTDSILCCSNSIQDILNLSGEKNKVPNVNFELFSIESMDRLALSPKKLSSPDPICHEPNIMAPPLSCSSTHLTASKNTLSICSDIKGSLKLDSYNDKHKASKISTLVNEEPREKANKELTVTKTPKANGWPKCNGNTEKKKNNEGDNTSKNSTSNLSIVAISEEESVQVNNQTVESFTSKIVQIQKRNMKNGVINPISSLWSHNSNKKDGGLEVLPPKLTEEKSVLDKLVKSDIFGSKSDIVQDIFGSPVKWADSDSTDFVPPSIDKDPSAFEDSRSITEEIKASLPPSKDVAGHKVSGNLEEKSTGKLIFFPPDIAGKDEGDNGKLSLINESKLKNDKISPCMKFQGAKYEDSILGQFDDTLQFVSALSKCKKTVSPIGTPEKISEKLVAENTQPFSTLNINQKSGFTIVGPTEKPINILTPRKTPRAVSPKKTNISSKTLISSDLKSSRISCLDDKAIESVCNLVSSIKDTHRETYLVISKKGKIVKNNSPKKLDNNSSNFLKIKSPNNAKVSPVKNGNCILSPNKNDKTSPGKKFPQLKFSPKKTALIKHVKTSKPKANELSSNNLSTKPENATAGSSTLTDSFTSQKKAGRIKLINSLPFIPKSNSCTKVKMSFELKKPTRMSKRKCERECTASPVKNVINKESERKNEMDNVEQKIIKGKADEYSLESKQRSVQQTSSVLQVMSESPNILRNSNGDRPVINNSSRSKPLINLVNNKVASTNGKGNEDSGLINNVTILSSVSNPLQSITKEKPFKNEHFKDELYTIKANTGNDEVKNIVSLKCVNLSANNLVDSKDKSLQSVVSDHCNLNDLKGDEIGFIKSSKLRNVSLSKSSKSSRHSSPESKVSKAYKSTSQSLKPVNRKESDSSNSKTRKQRPSCSSVSNFSKSEENIQSMRCTNFIEPYFPSRSSDIDRHYNKRFGRDSINLPFRQRLSRRYSCYRRREPSICRRSRSPRWDSKSSKYLSKQGSSFNRSRSPIDSHLRRDKKKHYHIFEKRKDIAVKPSSRTWGSSRIEAVTMSPRPQIDPSLPITLPYDRMNGISCNNIVWRLIEVDNVPDWPQRKTVLDSSYNFSPVQTPLMSPSPSSSMMSPKIVVKKRSFHFSSSEVKLESFSSSPNKRNSSGKQSSIDSQIFKTPPKMSVSLDHVPIESKESSANASSSKGKDSSKELPNNSVGKGGKKFASKEKETSYIKSSNRIESNEISKESTHLCVKPLSSKSSVSCSTLETSTVTYRMPSFMKKSPGKEMKTISVSRTKQKYSSIFSPRDEGKDEGVKKYSSQSKDIDETSGDTSLSSSDTSFTSDESWAPKKRRKKR